MGYTDSLLQSNSTQIIVGSNAIEHAINLVDESYALKGKRVLIVTGWNAARIDPLLWELEPRGFTIDIESISDQPSPDDIGRVLNTAMTRAVNIIIAMGCGGAIDTAKIVTSILRQQHSPSHETIPWLSEFRMRFEQDEIEFNATDLLLAVIPLLPCIGLETNSHSAARNQLRIPYKHFYTADYVSAPAPDVCIVQPNMLYRLPMTLLHDRLIVLFTLALEQLLTSTSFADNHRAWEALRILAPIVDKSIQSARHRLLQWTESPADFEDLTMNDMDPNHYSQYSKRYGAGLDERDIEEAGIASIALSSCFAGVNPVHLVADALLASTDTLAKHSFVSAQLALHYLHELHQFAFDEDASADRAVFRSKLTGVHHLLLASANVSDLALFAEHIRISYSNLQRIQDNSTAPLRTLPVAHWMDEDYDELKSLLSDKCGASPMVQLSLGALRNIVQGTRLDEASIMRYSREEPWESSYVMVEEDLSNEEKDELKEVDVDDVDRFRRRLRDLRSRD